MKKFKIIFQALFRRLLAHWKKPAAPVVSPAAAPLPSLPVFPFPVQSGDLVWCLMPLPQKELDQIPELMTFADKLEKATLSTIESGKMTKDLALITSIENPTVLNSEGFIKAVRENLEKSLA